MRVLGWEVCVCAALAAQAFEPVALDARELPVVRDADVVVVGGGSAAVAAAISAKTNGAEVLLLAPRIGLGDDLTATRELWPEAASESVSEPLAARLFTLAVPFSYVYNQTPAAAHPDTALSRLTDGVRNSASTDSVQFDADVVVTVTCQGVGAVTGVDLYFYRRLTSGGFDTAVAAVETSADGAVWTPLAFTATEQMTHDAADPTIRARLALPAGTRARHVRLTCNRVSGMARQLLDEVVLATLPEDPVPGSFPTVTPLKVRRELEAALEEAGVPFLAAAPVTDTLKDADGAFAGVVVANREGRQAVTARALVDATEQAWVARCAGAQKRPFQPGPYAFSRVVVADATNAPAAPGLTVEELPGLVFPATVRGVNAPAGMPGSVEGRVYRCTFTTNLMEGSMLELLEVEQTARDLTWVKTVIDAAERVTWLPPDTLVCAAQETGTAWPGADALNLDAFRPAGAANVYVLGPRADVSRALALELRHPARLMSVAGRVGAAAAASAAAAQPGEPVFPAAGTEDAECVRERGTDERLSLDGLPVFAECGVLVVGAGTAGAPAAIAAARAGADTVVLDILYAMGGVMTDGRIGVYYHGNVTGFTKDHVDPGWKATGAVLYAAKAEWFRRACRAAGARVLFGTLANGAIVSNGVVRGVVAVLPDGTRGVIRARTVVDATGGSEIAMAAGAQTEFLEPAELAVQGAGWARHELGNSYANTDVAFVDDTDCADLTFLARRVHKSLPDAVWDAGRNPASRERHRILGDVRVTPVDILNGRTYPDTITRARSNFDSHGFTTHDLFFIRDPGTDSVWANLPLRALLPQGLEGILVTGLGISAHRDAMPILRMQPDVQNHGYAAGYAAALAAAAGVNVRHVDVAQVQAHLVGIGILAPASAGTPDNFPLDAAQIQAAVEGLTNEYATLHTVLADRAAALPRLRAAHAAAEGDPAARLIYAHVLGLLGDPAGAAALTAKVDALAAWDTGWNYRGMGQYGRSVSWLDSYLIALGRTRAVGAVPAVLAKAALLDGGSRFSHVRASALALEELDGGSAVVQLSALLSRVGGHALSAANPAPVIPGYSNTAADTERNEVFRELSVARALYRLGDDAEGSAEAALAAYAQDPRVIYADYARLVLEQGMHQAAADGAWIGAAAEAGWDDAANWAGGARAGGFGARAAFTNDVPGPQAITLGGGLKTVGTLAFAGQTRTVSGGTLDIAGPAPEVRVEAGSAAVIAADAVVAQALAKTGDGGLTLAGGAALGGLDVREGDAAFRDPQAAEWQAYSTDPLSAVRFEPGGNVRSWRVDFRVNRDITVTHLGAFDSGGDGFTSLKSVTIRPRAGGAALAALAFAAGAEYPLSGGYRFRHLPEPLRLTPGDYAIVAYGFTNTDGHKLAGHDGAGGVAGTTVDGGGAVAFLPTAYYVFNSPAGFPATAAGVPADSPYGAAGGSFRFVTDAAVKRVFGPLTLAAGRRLDIGATDVRLLGGVEAGAGAVLTNASAARAVSLTLGVPAGMTNEVAAAALGDRADGPVALVKSDAGTLRLTGALRTRGGVHVALGTLAVDSPAALGADGVSFGNSGRIEAYGSGAVGGVVYTPGQTQANWRTARFVAQPGAAVTFTGAFETTRLTEFGGFALQPSASAEDATIAVDGGRFGFLDLYLLGDGRPGGGRARHLWNNARGGLRKLACGHETVDGCDVVFGAGCDFTANWFDMAGSNAVVSVADGAVIRVQNELRFVDGNASQLSLDGGVLQTPVFGLSNASSQHLSLRPVLFNGAVVRAARSNDTWFNLAEASAAPLIRDGGARLDTQGYEVAIRGRGFAQEPGASGPFVKLGSGRLTLAVPMTYTGPTLVSNGTLRLDFALWKGGASAANVLSPQTEVTVSAGAALEVVGQTNAWGEVTQFQEIARLAAADGAMNAMHVDGAALRVNALEGSWEKTGGGELALGVGPETVPFTGRLSVLEGAFAVRGVTEAVSAAVPCPGFESEPLLPDDPDKGKMDKRGAAATGCAGWTFVDNDAGYQRNNSYFSTHVDVQTTNGVQTAFVRRNSAMSCSFTLPQAANGCALRFQYAPRYYSNVWFTNALITVKVDGAAVDAFRVVERKFVERTVLPGRLEAGTHTLAFESATENNADVCTLIDDVRIGGVSDIGAAETLSSGESELALAAGTTVALEYAGVFEVGRLVIGGAVQPGGAYGAATRPDVFTGPGLLRVKGGGTRLILR